MKRVPRFHNPFQGKLLNESPQQATQQKEKNRGEKLTFGLELVLYGFLAIVLFQALNYYWQDSLKPMPRLLWFFTIIQLYLHEGGHFISIPFGETLTIFGGSFWQVMLPFLLFLFAWRERSRMAPFPLFYTGLCILDVSYYARDAMFRVQPLIGGAHKNMHDWFRLAIRWELQNDIEAIADVMYYFGALFCVAGLGAGFFLAVRYYFRPTDQVSGRISASVQEMVEKTPVKPMIASNADEKKAGSDSEEKAKSPNDDPWGLSASHQSNSSA